MAVAFIGKLPPFINALFNAFLIESIICIDYENTLRLQSC